MYILNRDDFTKEDILKVFLKPDQKWNSQILEEKYGKEWCIDYEKTLRKLAIKYEELDFYDVCDVCGVCDECAGIDGSCTYQQVHSLDY